MENRFDNPFEQQGMPQGLKVLTVLSIIGCVFQFISVVVNLAFAKAFYGMQEKQLEAAASQEMPAWLKKMMPDPGIARIIMEKTYDNRIPIFILGLIATGLCFYGVMQIRKLKKEGFNYYVIGQLLPFLSTALFIGTEAMDGFGFYFMVLISILFIGLYVRLIRRLN